MEQLKVLFRRWAGEPCTKCLALGANGSSRRYYRLVGDTHRCIGAIASDVRENEAFFAYSRHLLARGIRVPELYAVDDDRIHYLQQDLGDQTLYGLLYEKKQKGGGFDAQMLALYRQALADLHDIQVAGRDMDFSIAYPRPAFDTRSILWDLNYFKYNYLKLQHIPFDENRLEDDFQHLADTLLSADTNYFLYRDFNPRNIMVAESEKCALHTSHLSLHTSHLTLNNKTMGIIITILIGALAGFLAGKIMKGAGFGFWINLLVGIVGGFIGGNVLGWLGIHWGGTIVGQIVTAVIGAVILLWVISLIKKK